MKINLDVVMETHFQRKFGTKSLKFHYNEFDHATSAVVWESFMAVPASCCPSIAGKDDSIQYGGGEGVGRPRVITPVTWQRESNNT